MGAFGVGSEAVTLCEALKRRERYVTVNGMRDFNTILNEAYRLDPRLCGCVEGCEGKKSSQGLLGLNKTYQLEIKYSKNTPADIEKVILDDGTWKPSDALAKMTELPDALQIVTRDINGLQERIDNDVVTIQESYYGLTNVCTSWQQESCNGYNSLWVHFEYCVEPAKYHMYMTLAQRKIQEIDKRFFGSSSVPKIVKAFLVFSYLQQNCQYDQESADLMDANLPESMERPWVTMPYGPLVKNIGICSGISAAYKMFMDYYGITSRIVLGKADGGNHSWNMISLSNQYYHVDATFGITGDGVYVGSFMKDDTFMSDTHLWDIKKYPQCISKHPNYDYVENYIDEHFDELIRQGVDQAYLCPSEIRD